MAEPLISAERMRQAGNEEFGRGGVPNRKTGFFRRLAENGINWIDENIAEPISDALTGGRAELPEGSQLTDDPELASRYDVAQGFRGATAQGAADERKYARGEGLPQLDISSSPRPGPEGGRQPVGDGGPMSMGTPRLDDAAGVYGGHFTRDEAMRLESILDARPEVAEALMRRAEGGDQEFVMNELWKLLEE